MVPGLSKSFFFQACLLHHPRHLWGRKLIIPSLPQARLPHHPWHLQLCQAKVWIDKNGETRMGRITIPHSCQVKVWKGKNGETRSLLISQKSCWINQPKSQNQIKTRITSRYGETRIIPEWLQEFRENLVDDRVPERRDSHASSSHELSLEPTRSADLGKHSVYTHFPKDRNCEICQRT